MSQEQQQNLLLKENRKDEVDKNTTDKPTTDKPWIIVFEGLGDDKKKRFISSKSGFFLSEDLTRTATIKEDNLDKGFLITESSSYLRYFNDKKIVYEAIPNDKYHICVCLDKFNANIDIDDKETTVENIWSQINNRADQYKIKHIKDFNRAIDKIINTEEIINRFGDNGEAKILELKNLVNEKFKTYILEDTLTKLTNELNDSWSLIRKHRIKNKIEYVKKIQEDLGNYNNKILREIRSHTPNGLECCVCQYIAPWE